MQRNVGLQKHCTSYNNHAQMNSQEDITHQFHWKVIKFCPVENKLEFAERTCLLSQHNDSWVCTEVGNYWDNHLSSVKCVSIYVCIMIWSL